jgi:FG-GAP-like repeat/Abnormal spindle-like microcephaly-assoc'd, ASPM-SPD-2-Hydin
MTDIMNHQFGTGLFPLNKHLALTIFALLTIAAVSPANAQTYMFNRADYATGQGPETVAVGDFNGDGRLDVVTGNTFSPANTVSVLLGKADGTFAPHVDDPAGGPPSSVAVGDFNGDGKLDIAVLYGSSNASVGILLGNGDGTFRPVISTTAGPGGTGLSIGDFNGDGKLDVAIADDLTNNVDVMLGKGNASFNAPVSYPTGNSPRMVAVADYNGDGHLDLATINYGDQTISILLGTGTGTFSAHTDTPTKQAGCVSVVAGDLRNKGLIDLVAGCQTLGQVVVLLGNGNGTFKTAKDYAVPEGADIVALGDFNGDGKLDVAVTNGSSGGSVSVLTGNGTGTLKKTVVSYGTNFGPVGLAVGDFNGDGKLDVLTADSGSPFGTTIGNISVLLSNGKTLLGGHTDYPVSNASTTGAYSGIAGGDINGDGNIDLVVPVTFSNQLSLLLGTATGKFKPFNTISLPSSANAVAVGDFNNDHKADIALVNFGGGGTISILLNSGTGVFPTNSPYSTGGSGYGIATADFNNDGNLDIVVTGQETNNISVLLGNGTGAFPSFAAYTTGSLPMGVSVGDFNHDGFLDIAVANYGGGTVSVFINKGNGTFLPKVDYTVGGNPISVAVGSFRGNGTLDLAVATDQAFGGLAILLGNNDGTFQNAVTYDTLNNAYSIVAGDFNNDDKLDLAITIANAGNPSYITIMPGNGDGSFGNGVTLTTGSIPSGMVAADFNKDGGLDLATANGSTVGDIGSASVLLNDPVIGLHPSTLAFAAQKVGTTSASQTITLGNPGATPFKLTSITIGGADSKDFVQTNDCPKSLTTGANCTIDVSFSPTATGARTGTLTIEDKALSSPQTIALSGTGS